jgi:hypothetical protein
MAGSRRVWGKPYGFIHKNIIYVGFIVWHILDLYYDVSLIFDTHYTNVKL